MDWNRADVKLEWEFRPKPRKAEKPTARSKEQPSVGKVPRIARLMALAIKLDGLVRSGVVRDYADLARLGHVTRARMTQIMNLLNLAPDIQEMVLFLSPTFEGRHSITERDLRQMTSIVRWDRQRKMWERMNDPRQ